MLMPIGTFTHRVDSSDATDITQSSPLTPFYQTANDLITSLDCQTTTVYGYTYPEIANAYNTSPNDIPDAIFQSIDQLYGAGSLMTVMNAPPERATNMAVEALRQGVEKITV